MRRRWTRAALGYLGLALLAYVPVLRSSPGKVAADTKQYLYLDPGRLLDRAVTMWDPNIGMGTVTHQNIGYLFPMGPYYWVLDRLGVPDWVAQRLWLGSLLFAAGAGVLYLLRTFGLRGPGRRRRRARVHAHAVLARLRGAHLGAPHAVGRAAVDDRADAQGVARRRMALSRRSSRSSCRSSAA